MRGTSCTKFTLWICLFSYSMTVWLSWTHTWHKANKNIFFMLSSITETTCFSLNDHSVVQLKMSVRWSYTMTSATPYKPVFPSCNPSALSPALSLLCHTKQGHDIHCYSNFLVAQALKRNLWMLLPSPNTIRQLSFICAIRPVSSSVKVLLPNSHTVMNDIPLLSKVVFWQMLQRLPRRGFHSFIHLFVGLFFFNYSLCLKLKLSSLLLFFF